MSLASSSFYKKRSTRATSFVNRQSLASLMGRKSNNKMSTAGSAKIISGIGELRCIKNSPRVGQIQTHVGEELSIFEATQWRNAFSTMGKLHARGLKSPKPFTVLNKAPYHCSSMGREFEVRYGELVKMELPVFRKTTKADRPQICNCIIKEVLPVLSEKKISGSFNLQATVEKSCRPPKTKYYLPKSTVYVRWDPAVHSNTDKICEWLISTFGTFLFTVRTASNSMLVAFDNMQQAHSAVTFQLKSAAKIYISWYDSAMYNFGHYQKYVDYSIASDPIWKKGMEEKLKGHTVKPMQKQKGKKSIKI